MLTPFTFTSSTSETPSWQMVVQPQQQKWMRMRRSGQDSIGNSSPRIYKKKYICIYIYIYIYIKFEIILQVLLSWAPQICWEKGSSTSYLLIYNLYMTMYDDQKKMLSVKCKSE